MQSSAQINYTREVFFLKGTPGVKKAARNRTARYRFISKR